MRIPKKLKIAGVMYDVVIASNNDMEGKSGTTHGKKGQISINKDMGVDYQGLTFFHEMLHAFNMEWQDEVQIEWIAQLLYATLKDNNMLK